ncbi:XisH family protein [Dolichospermum compactum]|uniref:FdxN element excision controlling factor protein XisH n=2 Tax=Nostocales TaxID=1161 RepID=A0A1Z4V8B8_9CYAN|nr:XisH family protein [Dolichospermum compactum]BAZ87792.1 fdxN element excision controlling factor protein XisH [Dolichospermum compactum NIES-806]
MSARDLFHQAVRTALEKEGWIITDDPLEVELEEITFRIDLGAERLIAAEKGEQKIAVEIKSFASNSAVSEFYTALGQFLNYQTMLEEIESERELYLAVPKDAYISFFQTRFAKITVKKYQVKIIVYNPDQEVIIQWQT